MIRRQPEKNEKKELNISFYAKDQIECPICGTKFKKEELHSGGGRLIAGELTDELRRTYENSERYGEIFPPIYQIVVCPKCLYATFLNDFRNIDKDTIKKIFDTMESRYLSVRRLIPTVDFNTMRTLSEGAVSYYLAILCYDAFDKKFSPTIKQAVCALRAAWLFSDLGTKYPEENYTYVSSLFYQKALFFYRNAVELESKGKEMIAGMRSFGPDTDKNYGYDGVLYLSCLLEYKYGSKKDPELRKERMQYNKRVLAKMFGLGKSSKEKPGPLLEMARDLYDKFKLELNEDD
ncbi:DUF2225 domain-containing protein [Treponema phagedenis]|uniref:DUF2225 domain-containing protein n=1 Tax=Treponema phagedenis TaxID=162 RepID=UPI0001F63D12|nr:DUF2225 domain-containing protein [Treponema phagedenis]EFW37434.1 hypothetical protein HMPREF9554_02009 [Treponema phagedenis F0421]QEJ95912.1 DUF2225 domain-containing protein [Treponema phagedenis]TYT78305.1 DUF2225 domain-containing protein [Treponema phagedenis]